MFNKGLTYTYTKAETSGIFALEHTFEFSGGKEGETCGMAGKSNLMDYCSPQGTFMAVWQWNLLDNHKDRIIPFLEGDEDGMYKPWANVDQINACVIAKMGDAFENLDYYTFSVLDGSKFALPKEATNLRFHPDGYLISFVIYDKEEGENVLYESAYFVSTKKFAGFYKDMRKNANNTWSRTGNAYPNHPEAIDKNFVYMPIFNFFNEEKTCYSTFVYKVPYDNDKELKDYISLYSNFKSMTEEDRKKDDYSKKVYYDYELFHCLPSSLRQFYMFMINNYDYYNDELSDVVRKNDLYETLALFDNIKIHGIDDTKNCLVEVDLSSSKNCDIENFIKAIKKKNNDIKDQYEWDQKFQNSLGNEKCLCVTFDNYSVYQDYYLKQFSDTEKGEPKCNKAQWESDLTLLNNFYDAVKNNQSEIKIDAQTTIKNPDIYDFCNHITNMCHDYLHTVQYEIIEQYLRLIVDHCSGKNETGFSFTTFLHRFNDPAEKASLWLMRAIDKSDYGKFAKFLAENNNGVLFGYMKKFDDAHVTAIFPCDGNNYTKFMRVLVTMFRANPAAFINTDPKHCNSEKDIIIMKNYKSNYDKNDETGLCHLDIKNEDGNIFFNKDGLSPFTQIYFVIDKENAPQKDLVGKFDEFTLDEDVYKRLGIEVEPDVFLISCPLIFLQYYEDKENVDFAENVAIAAGVVVGTAALVTLVGPELMLFIAKEGVSVASKWIATRYGQKGMLDFTVGALVEGTSYMIGSEISQFVPPSKDTINTIDLLYHMVIGGLSNMIEKKWASTIFTCVQAMDFSSIYKCLTSESDKLGCSSKLVMECGSAILLDRLFSIKKVQEALYGVLGKRVLNKFIDKFGPVPMKLIMTLYTKINKTKNPSLVDDIVDLQSKYGLKGLSLLTDAEFPFENLGKDALEGVFKAMYKDQSQNTYKNLKGLLSKNYESIAPLLGMLNKVEKPSGFSSVIDEIWKKAKKFEVRDKTTGVSVKLNDILDNPFKYTKELKVFSKFDEKNDLMTYRYILLDQVIECQVKAVSSGFSNIAIKLLDDAYDYLFKPSSNLENNQITDDGYELEIFYGIQDEG